MKSMLRLFAIMFVVWGGIAPFSAWAQAGAAPQVDPATLAAARDLMILTRTDEMAKQMVTALINNLLPLIAKANPGQNDAIKALMEKYFVPALIADFPLLRDKIAILYAQNFSLDELQKLAAFYKTPAGQKYISIAPSIAVQAMQFGRQWGVVAAAKAVKGLIEELKRNNLQVPQGLGT